MKNMIKINPEYAHLAHKDWIAARRNLNKLTESHKYRTDPQAWKIGMAVLREASKRWKLISTLPTS